jgi:hypothetical protein
LKDPLKPGERRLPAFEEHGLHARGGLQLPPQCRARARRAAWIIRAHVGAEVHHGLNALVIVLLHPVDGADHQQPTTEQAK